MKFMELLRSIFHTQSASNDVHDMKNEITRETLKTTTKLNKAKKTLINDTGITLDIARAVGALK